MISEGAPPVLHRLMRHSTMQVTMDFYASVDDVLHDKIGQLDNSQALPGANRPTAGPTAGPQPDSRQAG
jgi:hypothetical protein